MGQQSTLNARNGKLHLYIIEGEVVHQQQQTWSETRVTSSGGGGYINPNHGGYVEAPTIHSSVSTHQLNEFWLREADGKETMVKMVNTNFGVAPGQRLRLAYGNSRKSQPRLLYGQNLNSRTTYDFLNKNWWNWARNSGLINYPFLYRLLVRWLPLSFFSAAIFFAPNVRYPDAEMDQKLYGSNPATYASNKRHLRFVPNRSQGETQISLTKTISVLPNILDPVRALQGWSDDDAFWVGQPKGLIKPGSSGEISMADVEKDSMILSVRRSHITRDLLADARDLVVVGGITWAVLEGLGFVLFAGMWRRFAARRLQKRVLAAFVPK